MILTDVLEFVGKQVMVIFEDGTMSEGLLEYIQSYSELSGWRRPKHFYIGDRSFRAWHVKEIKEI